MSGSSSPSSHTEIELKYEIGADAVVPDIADLLSAHLPDAVLDAPRVHRLEATYFDTRDQRLAAARITLRRRTGGTDAGWHLKLPGGKGTPNARREVRLPLGRAVKTVPQPLQRMVRVFTRGAALVPVALLSTERTTRDVLDAGGVGLAEVADDSVTARRLLAPPAEAAWRELEVELLSGDGDLLAEVDRLLREAGVEPAGHASKLSRAMGPAPETPAPRRLTRRTKAVEVLRAHLAEQVGTIRTHDPLVRLDEEDAVHKMRVATRRIRSALTTFRPVLDRERTDPLREELKWLAAELGAVRDAEVLRERLIGSIETEDPALVLGPVVTTLTTKLDADYRTAHEELLRTLDGARYDVLLSALDALVTEPPGTEAAAKRARNVLPGCVAGVDKKLRKRIKAARRADADPGVALVDADHLWHEARKVAKAARYAGEALEPVWGAEAKAYAKAVETIQEVLGEHQDSVVTRDLLRDLARVDTVAGAFTFGRLHAAEEHRGEETRAQFETAWKVASKKKVRAWFDAG